MIFLSLLFVSILEESFGASCEPIKIDVCKFTGYNSTRMPNFANHLKQADAKVELETFAPLIDSRCSNELPFFLCSVYAPMCAELVGVLVGPCRPLCEKVRGNCEGVLSKMGYDWPKVFECSRFPAENKEEEMCMKGPGEGVDPPKLPISTLHTFRTNPLFRKRVKQHLSSDPELTHKYKDYVKLLETDLNMRNPATSTNSECRHLKRSSQYLRISRLKACVPLCQSDILFDSNQKAFARIWMAVWSSLCFTCTLFTLFTFSLNTTLFKFPDKSVVFLAFCFLINSLGYIFSLFAGRETVSCQVSDEDPKISLLTIEGLRNEYCVFSFLLSYFSFHSASAWWTVGTFTWLLSNYELPYEKFSPAYHTYAWGSPAVFSIAALILKKVDASELTGMCSVGNQDKNTLLIFEILPETIQFALNIILFAVGLVVSPRQRKIYSKIGVFWILYTLPKMCVIGCMYYEYLNKEAWLDVTKSDRPNMEIFMLRICMSLVIGIATGYWIWSQKTLNSWKQLGRSCLGFWRREKKPPTPTFPTVRYRPQPVGDLQNPKSRPVTGETIEIQGQFRRPPISNQIVL